MWMERLSQGVLRVLTPLGPRYVRPDAFERLYLMWVFRNFRTLSASVLSRGQQKRIERMCAERGYVSQFGPNRVEEFAVLGTLEQRPPAQDTLPPRRPPASVRDTASALVADAQHQS